MRYIKKFNESNDYYDEITKGLYDIKSKIINNFSKYEIEKLISVFDIWDRNGYEFKIDLKNIHLNIGGDIFGKNLNIQKVDDGYYLIDVIPNDAWTFAVRNSKTYESYRKYFRCDQFDGVLTYLKDIIKHQIHSDVFNYEYQRLKFNDDEIRFFKDMNNEKSQTKCKLINLTDDEAIIEYNNTKYSVSKPNNKFFVCYNNQNVNIIDSKNNSLYNLWTFFM